MALFSKIKQAVQSVTGGGAKVSLMITTPPSRQQPFHVQVKAVVADSDIKPARVYVTVESVETATVSASVENRQQQFSNDATIFQTSFNIAGAQELTAKQEYTWEGDVQLPASVLPTYRGRNARHEWRIKAGLDLPGNDPDSGWTAIEIQ